MRISLTRCLVLAATAVLAVPTLYASFPSSRTGARMAFDESRGRIILFGGISGVDSASKRVDFQDTWEWSGSRWFPLYPAATPAARSAHVMVYDRAGARIVMFGGVSGDQARSDTWQFQNGAWQEISTATVPPARSMAAAAYDADANRIVMYGGRNATADVHDTWVFQGTSWTQLTTATTPALGQPTMAYDEVRNQMILLGYGSSGPETWKWDRAASNWVKQTVASTPACLFGSAMTFEKHSGRVVFIGGGCPVGDGVAETWVWSGTDWTKLTIGKTQEVLVGHAVATDRNRRETLIFGGSAIGVRNRTWTFKFDKWRLNLNSGTPGPRSVFVLEQDPARGVTWLFGGHNDTFHLPDLWKYENGSWTEIAPETGSPWPTGCHFPTGTFDTGRQRLVVFCENTQTWEWDGTRWFTFENLQKVPNSRRWPAMEYDEQLQRTILFGGWGGLNYANDTWTWNGTTWTEDNRNGKIPPIRSNATLFFDPVSRRTILFGGIGRVGAEDRITRFGDLWTFNGTTWTELTTITTKPTVRYGSQVSWDPETQKTILFGGKGETEEYLGDQWAFDGTTWAQVDAQNRPPARMNGGMAYDPSTHQMILFGGYAIQYFFEVWRLNENRWEMQREVEPAPAPPDLPIGARPFWKPGGSGKP